MKIKIEFSDNNKRFEENPNEFESILISIAYELQESYNHGWQIPNNLVATSHAQEIGMFSRHKEEKSHES